MIIFMCYISIVWAYFGCIICPWYISLNFSGLRVCIGIRVFGLILVMTSCSSGFAACPETCRRLNTVLLVSVGFLLSCSVSYFMLK